ncbi:hypothetical protein [Halomonas sp. WWR20]
MITDTSTTAEPAVKGFIHLCSARPPAEALGHFAACLIDCGHSRAPKSVAPKNSRRQEAGDCPGGPLHPNVTAASKKRSYRPPFYFTFLYLCIHLQFFKKIIFNNSTLNIYIMPRFV